MQQFGLRLTSTSARSSATSSVARCKPRSGIRRLHKVPPLPYPPQHGLGKFLPPDAMKVQLEFQQGLITRLNEQVAGTQEASTTVAQAVINLAGKKEKALAYTYASLALNNSFFLDNLKPPAEDYPHYEHEISDELHGAMRTSHGSIQQFRSAFSAACLGTFLNGWVWFVTDQDGSTSVVNTYGAGTLLVRSRVDMARHPNFPESGVYEADEIFEGEDRTSTFPLHTQGRYPGVLPSSPLSGVTKDTSPLAPRNLHPRLYSNEAANIASTAEGIHNSLQSTKKSKIGSMLTAGEVLYPLFCVPTYEHAWMSAGYGVWGKEEWLKELWSVLNWQRIDAAYRNITKQTMERAASRKIY